MKKHIGYMITGNFFRFSVYEITDAAGKTYYIAEPVGIGATRFADSLEKLQALLDKDVWMLRRISRGK